MLKIFYSYCVLRCVDIYFRLWYYSTIETGMKTEYERAKNGTHRKDHRRIEKQSY
jgi:uncharacterized Fe-S radical SAM superfamily protein PflX